MQQQARSVWLLYLLVPLLFLLVNEYYFHALSADYLSSDNRRIIQGLMLVIVSASLLTSYSLRQSCLLTFLQLPKLARFALLLFFVIGISSALLAPLTKYALLQVAWYFLLLCGGLLISALYQQKPTNMQITLLTTIISAASCYCLFAFTSYWFEWLHHAAHPEAFYNMALLAWPGFVNARFLMQFISWAIPFMVIPVMLYRNVLGYWTSGCYAFAAYLWCLDIANQSRIVPIQIIVISIVSLLVFKRHALPWLKQQLAVFSAGLTLYVVLFHILLSSTTRDLVNYSDTPRLTLWKLAIQFAIEHPLLGVGPLHYPYYAYATEHFAAHPHNAIFMIAAEWGLIAAICLFGVAIWGFWRWLKVMPKREETPSDTLYSIALTASLLAAGLDAMVDGIAVMPLSQVMLATISGWMLGMYYKTSSHSMDSISRVSNWVFFGLILMSLGIMLHGIWPDILYLNQNQDYFLASCHYTCLLNPNFWTQGWIQFYTMGVSS